MWRPCFTKQTNNAAWLCLFTQTVVLESQCQSLSRTFFFAKGVPLVYEALSWQHGVLVGAAMRSEATAAAEHKGKSRSEPNTTRKGG
jgi:hypothetical protein